MSREAGSYLSPRIWVSPHTPTLVPVTQGRWPGLMEAHLSVHSQPVKLRGWALSPSLPCACVHMRHESSGERGPHACTGELGCMRPPHVHGRTWVHTAPHVCTGGLRAVRGYAWPPRVNGRAWVRRLTVPLGGPGALAELDFVFD